jgi:tRNA dimethylallyltransferase
MYGKVLIISGPTASGKTELAQNVGSFISCEYINADVGQFYTQLNIGVAKPDFSLEIYKNNTHCFNICDVPRDINVIEYRERVIKCVKEILSRGNLPVIVGGSLFYIKSLFFPPLRYIEKNGIDLPAVNLPEEIKALVNKRDLLIHERSLLWDFLKEIDFTRAKEISQNDSYRIIRAIKIWERTGVLPSSYKPVCDSPFNALFIFLSPEKNILRDNIKKRVDIMLKSGWIEECKGLIGSEWEEFIKSKNLIGYPELFKFIRDGEKESELSLVREIIFNKTVQYAKRQITFWRSFVNMIRSENKMSLCDMCEINRLGSEGLKEVLNFVL